MQPSLNLLLRRKYFLSEFVWSDTLSQATFASWLNTLKDTKYAQLFVEGASALGKTHLLLSTCQHARTHDLNSRYVDLSKEPIDLIDSVTDVYCIDNVESVIRHSNLAISIVHFLEHAQQRKQKVILSMREGSDTGLADLQTRLRLGLSLRLGRLTKNQKAEALSKRSKSLGLSLSNTLIQTLIDAEMENHQLFQYLEQLDKAQLSSHQRLNKKILELLKK